MFHLKEAERRSRPDEKIFREEVKRPDGSTERIARKKDSNAGAMRIRNASGKIFEKEAASNLNKTVIKFLLLTCIFFGIKNN